MIAFTSSLLDSPRQSGTRRHVERGSASLAAIGDSARAIAKPMIVDSWIGTQRYRAPSIGKGAGSVSGRRTP
ncbi:MAG: hypothetical protein ABJE10_00210 [bacterium]